MTTTALHSDYVLPVSGWYERAELKWVTALTPFIHAGAQVAEPHHESRSDWEVLSLLAKAVQKRARESGVKTFVDRRGSERRLDDVYENFSRHGAFGPTDEEKVAQALLENASNLEGVTWDELKERGWARFTGLGTSPVAIGTATEVRPDDTITHFTKHVFDKEPYPTLSRRIQFYQDHELYLEMGEELPRHKAPPTAGGNYPLLLSGGHTRWSIHASWRDDALMLQQQRGEPVMYMASLDAEARGIRDGEIVGVFNDLDEFQVMAKLSPAIRPGTLVIYHAWENYQFRDGVGYQSLIPSPLNPVELSGGQYHLRPMSPCLQPSHTDRDTRVEVRKRSDNRPWWSRTATSEKPG
jgi:nitrate reductase alpha subunit